MQLVTMLVVRAQNAWFAARDEETGQTLVEYVLIITSSRWLRSLRSASSAARSRSSSRARAARFRRHSRARTRRRRSAPMRNWTIV